MKKLTVFTSDLRAGFFIENGFKKTVAPPLKNPADIKKIKRNDKRVRTLLRLPVRANAK